MAAGDPLGPPVPDPTVLTTAQLLRQTEAERDYVDGQLEVLRERLRGIDRATEVLNETVNRTPTDIQKEITHLRELMEERTGSMSHVMAEQFRSIATQFSERDNRSERESRDNKVAVDAAFAAQKEAAAKQDESNAKAIDKSEKATTETIKTLTISTTEALKTLGESFQTNYGAFNDKIDDIKERIGSVESRIIGLDSVKLTHDRTTETGQKLLFAVLGLMMAVAAIVVTVVIALTR